MANIKDLEAQKRKNSAAWHNADEKEKDRLHQENIKIQKQIDAATGGHSTFNKGTGTWHTAPAGGGAGGSQSSGGSPTGGGGSTGGMSYQQALKPDGMDDYGNVDYSKIIRDAMNAGAAADDVQTVLDRRTAKATTDGRYGKYAFDQTYADAQAYIEGKRKEEANNGVDELLKQLQADNAEFADRQEQAAREEAEARKRQAELTYRQQQEDLNQGYDDLNRQLYIDRRRAEKALPQQMAILGHTGGLSEDAALGIQTDYEDNLRKGETSRIQANAALEKALQNALLTGDIELARQLSQMAGREFETYAGIVGQQIGQRNADRDYLARQEQADRAEQHYLDQFSYQKMMDELQRDDVTYERKLQLAQIIYQATGDASGFREVGLTDGQIQALTAAARQPAPVRTTGRGGGRRTIDTGTPAPTPEPGDPQRQYDEAADRWTAGDFSPEVIETLLAAGDTPAGLAKAAGLIPAIAMIGPEWGGGRLEEEIRRGSILPIDIGGSLYYKQLKQPAGAPNWSGILQNGGW